MSLKGRIHSVETYGTVDGPGIRFVLFFQGCPLRCLYCHNPDTRSPHSGEERSIEDVFQEILKYRSFFAASGGGVTLSGGEPLLQPEFVFELAEACRLENIHTALDTSGFASLSHERVRQAVDEVSLVLLDIKSYDPNTYQNLTGASLEPTLAMARYLAEREHPTWIRYVLVPGWTDQTEQIEGLADLIAPMKNIERVQVLPFHKMGEFKWKQLGFEYKLEATQPPTLSEVNRVKNIFRRRGLKVE